MSKKARQPKYTVRQSSLKLHGSTLELRAGERASIRPIVLIFIFCSLAVAVGAFWFFRGSKRATTNGVEGRQPSGLSDSTKAVLKRLDAPVAIRFYALLDPTSVSASLQAFAGRVDELLSRYEREGDGKIDVTRYNSRSDINAIAAAAAADGLKPFNLDKGDACYFGLAAAQDGRKESLPQLSPEWEQALEFDLTRAIENVASGKHPPQSSANKSPTELAAAEEVKRAIPNPASVSMEEGTRMLRVAALAEFKAAAAEMEVQVKAAEQRLSQAQNGGSETELQDALKHLQQAKSKQVEKLQQIAAKSSAQVEALRQLKEAAR